VEGQNGFIQKNRAARGTFEEEIPTRRLAL
jgi:hypothetical protein